MNEKEIKIVMTDKNGSALIGKHFHILEDRTRVSFATGDPESFKKFLGRKVVAEKNPDLIITFTEETITATTEHPQYGDEPVATCVLKENPLLDLIRGNRSSVGAPNFEKFLYTMRNYYDPNGKDLYDKVKHLVVEKVTKIERKADNQGNYHLAITRTNGREDLEPTPTITFLVALFDNPAGYEFKIEFDVHMEYKEIDAGVLISYSLVNPFFEELLKKAKLAAIQSAIQSILTDSTFPVLSGTVEIESKTNAWQFKDNGLN